MKTAALRDDCGGHSAWIVVPLRAYDVSSKDLGDDLLDFPSESPERTRARRTPTRMRSSAVAVAFGCGLVVGGVAVWSTGDAVEQPTPAPRTFQSPSRPPLYVSLDARTVAVATAGVRDDRAVARKRSDGSVFRGSLFVESSPPGARVFLNGRAAGQTPLLLNNQVVGSRAVRVALDGYDSWTSTVQIVTGRQARLRAQLKATPNAAAR